MADARRQLEELREELKELKKEARNGTFEAGEVPPLDRSNRPSLRRTLRGHFGKVTTMHWAGGSRPNVLVSASQDSNLIVWDANSTLKNQAFSMRSQWVMACAFEQERSELVACGGLDNACSLYKADGESITNGRAIKELVAHDGYLSSCRFVSPKRLITASGDSTCIFWDINRVSMISTYTDHSGDVMNVDVSPTDSNTFLSCSVDMTSKLWDIRAKRSVMTFTGHESDINVVKFFPDGMCFATGSDDSSCRLYDLRCHQEVNIFMSPKIPCGITSAAFSNSGRLLFAGYDDKDWRAWDVVQPSPKGPVFKSEKGETHENLVSTLGVSVEGTALCTGSWDSLLKIFA